MSKEIPEDVFKPFSNVSNKEIYQAAIVDNHNCLQVNDLDRIDVYCNNKLCENVKQQSISLSEYVKLLEVVQVTWKTPWFGYSWIRFVATCFQNPRQSYYC